MRFLSTCDAVAKEAAEKVVAVLAAGAQLLVLAWAKVNRGGARTQLQNARYEDEQGFDSSSTATRARAIGDDHICASCVGGANRI